MIGGDRGGHARAAEPAPARATPAYWCDSRVLDVARESGLGIALRSASAYGDRGRDRRRRGGGGERPAGAAARGRGRAPSAPRPPQVAEPVGFIPEDRTTEGLIPALTLTENVVLGSSPRIPGSVGGTVDWRAAEARTAAAARRACGHRAPGPGVPAASLSGGNQQKLVVAPRALASGPPSSSRRTPPAGSTSGPRPRSTPGSAGPLRRRSGAVLLQRSGRSAGAGHPHRGR